MKLSRLALAVAMLGFGLTSLSAFAGRPMSTDDAATVGDNHYQVEAWRDWGDNQHTTNIAPAVGFGNFELGLGWAKSVGPEGGKSYDKSLALKWATPAVANAPLRFGVKGWTSQTKDTFESMSLTSRENGVTGLASLTLNEQIAFHANLGWARNRSEQRYERITNLAVSYQPATSFQLFGEVLHQQYSATKQAVGGRVWAIPEKLGIDLTYSRLAGVDNSRAIGLGLGWYGDFGK